MAYRAFPNATFVFLLASAVCLVDPVDQVVAEAQDPSPETPRATDFERQIRPLLERYCWECHGGDTQESGLRLDQLASLLRGGDSGEPAIIPGRSGESHLLALISSTDLDQRMPPDGYDPLTEAEIDLLRVWIDAGAEWSGDGGQRETGPAHFDHWAFQPLRKPMPPDPQSVLSPIDAFISAGLAAHHLAPNPRAARRTLIRRLSLDLLGLPPTPDQVDAFERDESPAAYERLVDRMLADPAYGERWGRHWLDLVRFAETDGFETNRERPNAWPFRDYVVDSLNADIPYDQFVIQQIAGDAVGTPVATGFLVAGTRDIVQSPDINLTRMQRQNELDDMINTTSSVFVGLTVGCARCHNHKFDPVTQRDYYAMQAIFAGTQHGESTLPLTEDRHEQIAAVEQQVARLRDSLAPYRTDASPRRPAVTAQNNEDRFAAIDARFVRFTILATNSDQPCLDELEIFSGDENVALCSSGANVTCSSTLPGYEIHRLEHVHDGRYGNAHSWISNEPGTGWIQVALPRRTTIDRVIWSRDREGIYQDRLATEYEISVSDDGHEWATVSTGDDRIPFATPATQRGPDYDLTTASPSEHAVATATVRQLGQLEAELTELRELPRVYAGNFQQPGPTHRLFRGEPQSPREPVEPETVAFLGSLGLSGESAEQDRRRALAAWIVNEKNPLTARVIANRVWQHHFGRGLVATPSDFGAAGAAATHPRLLDYLSVRLIESDWSLKHLHREILNSATYCRSSQPSDHGMRVDAATTWLWRFPPRRLEAESIRDSILQVSGSLDRRMGGPGFSGFEVELENVRHYHPKTSYGPQDWRRMVYMTKVRQEQDSVFGIFDCPDGAASVPARNRSTTPLQALNLFNSQFVLEQAEILAEKLEQVRGNDVDAQVRQAYQWCYARDPDIGEMDDAREFISEVGLVPFCRAVLNSNEFVFLP